MKRPHAPTISRLVNRAFNWQSAVEVRQEGDAVVILPRPSSAQVLALKDHGYRVRVFARSAVVTSDVEGWAS